MEEKTNIEFVERVQRNPVVWDHTLANYHKAKETEKAWSNIAAESNLPSGKAAKEKWRNLRTAFVRSCNRKQKSKSGTGRKLKEYYLKDAMSFILPLVKSHGLSSSNLDATTNVLSPSDSISSPHTPVTNSAEEDDAAEDNGTEDAASVSSARDTSPAPSTVDINVEPILVSALIKAATNRRTDKTATEMMTPSLVDKTLMQYIRTKMQSQREHEHENPDLLFFKSILPDMALMNHRQKRLLKTRVLAAIDEILDTAPSTSISSTFPAPFNDGSNLISNDFPSNSQLSHGRISSDNICRTSHSKTGNK